MSSTDMLAQTGVLINDTCIDGMRLVACVQTCDDGYIYRAEDGTGELKACVHEYLPHALARRVNGQVVVNEGARQAFDEGLRRFTDQARRLSTFSHPAVAAIDGVWSRNGTSYVQTAWHEGQSLWHRLAVSREEVAPHLLDRWLIECADALQALREKGIAHEVLTPHRLHLVSATRCVMMPVLNAGPRTTETLPWYATEKVLTGEPTLQVGTWSDVYSLAALACLAVTGQPPKSVEDRLNGVWQAPFGRNFVSPFDMEMLQAIDKGLSLNPLLRPKSVDDWLALAGCRAREVARELGPVGQGVAAAGSAVRPLWPQGYRQAALSGAPGPMSGRIRQTRRGLNMVTILALVSVWPAWWVLSGGGVPGARAAKSLSTSVALAERPGPSSAPVAPQVIAIAPQAIAIPPQEASPDSAAEGASAASAAEPWARAGVARAAPRTSTHGSARAATKAVSVTAVTAPVKALMVAEAPKADKPQRTTVSTTCANQILRQSLGMGPDEAAPLLSACR